MSEIQFKSRELFGGAITCNIPENFTDVSDIRQVPDTQEVFVDPNSDLSLIVEILQRVERDNDKDAIEFHFNALAEDNSARSAHVFEILPWNELPRQSTDITPRPIVLRGQQEVQKFNKSTSDNISISLALFRIESRNTDIVVSINAPGLLESSKAPSIFTEAISSFKIHDLGLFVGTEQMTDD